jgi:hypothetical protein
MLASIVNYSRQMNVVERSGRLLKGHKKISVVGVEAKNKKTRGQGKIRT